jgi:hypothetical protein
VEPRPAFFGTWFADMIRLDRTEYLIFVNGPTLLSFLVGGIKRRALREPIALPPLFMDGLLQLMMHEEVEMTTLLNVGAAHSPIALGIPDDADRPTLDALEQIVHDYRSLIAEYGGSNGEKLSHIIGRANRIPRAIDGANNPLEAWMAMMNRMIETGSPLEQQMAMYDILHLVACEEWKEIGAELMKDLIPAVFPTIADFALACNDYGIECTMANEQKAGDGTPEQIESTSTNISLKLRVPNPIGRFGISMPGTN